MGIPDLGAIGIPAGRGKLDIVGLPDERRKGHVQVGFPLAIECSKSVEERFESKGVQYLAFVSPLKIEATVASLLSFGDRHVRNPEFGMQIEVLKHGLNKRAFAEQSILGHFAVRELIYVGTIKKNDSAFWRFGAQGGAPTMHAFQSSQRLAGWINDSALLGLHKNRPGPSRQDHDITISTPHQLDRCARLVPILTWQSSSKRDRFKIIAADAPDLERDRFVLVFSGFHGTCEFAHQRKADVTRRGFRKSGAFALVLGETRSGKDNGKQQDR